MSLHDLSNEILLNIFDWLSLESRHWTTTLCSVVKCSKRLNSLAIPLLYRDFSFESWRNQLLLLRTLVCNPTLGTFCKSLNTAQDDHDMKTRLEFLLKFEEILLCESRIQKYSSSPRFTNEWLRGINEGHSEASTAFLLTCMPNIKSLHLHRMPRDAHDFFGPILTEALLYQAQGIESPFALSSFNFLRIDPSIPRDCVSLQMTLPFLQLPSLKTAHLALAGDDIVILAPEPTLELDTLTLEVCQIDGTPSCLDGFFSHFKSLRCLQLNGYEPLRYTTRRPHTLDDALSRLMHSLEKLQVNHLDRDLVLQGPWISSLAGFEKLRELSIDMQVVSKINTHLELGRRRDIFPTSLEVLEVVDFDPNAIDLLINILREREEMVPNLRKIVLNERNWSGPGGDDEFQEENMDEEVKERLEQLNRSTMGLWKHCQDAGIMFTFIEDDLEWIFDGFRDNVLEALGREVVKFT